MGGVVSSRHLVCRVHDVHCALPLGAVIETMRLLPVEPIAGAPAAVRGISIIRGGAVPVVDLGLVIGERPATGVRVVTVRAADRTVALVVDDVLGVQPVRETAAVPLLARSEAIAELGEVDGALLLVLRATRLVELAP